MFGWREKRMRSHSRVGNEQRDLHVEPVGELVEVPAGEQLHAPQPIPQRVVVDVEEIQAFYAKSVPSGRIGMPDDIARTVVFLSTESARAFVGQTIQPNGGEVRASV
jgi:NAD(P)-dependent dehydrogenase (short-subunit alcohol dehydrogenase family)